MRCFIAVDLTPELKRPLINLLRGLPRSRDVRWCTENQLHITLKFLGEVGEAQIPDICDAITAAAAEITPFPIHLGKLGCFPLPHNPRVLWCGIEDQSGGCAGWVELADPLMSELGFQPESRAFTPHITLGRSKSRTGSAQMREILENGAELPSEEMTVRQVILFESQLLPRGARYTPVATIRLGGPRS